MIKSLKISNFQSHEDIITQVKEQKSIYKLSKDKENENRNL